VRDDTLIARPAAIGGVAAGRVLPHALYRSDATLGEPATFAPSEWVGVWIAHDGSPDRVRSGIPGVNGLATTDNWRECDVAVAGRWSRIFPADARQIGDWYFDKPCAGRSATGEPCPLVLVVRRSKESMFLYAPDETRIRELVMQGKLPGRIELFPTEDGQKERVVVGTLAPKHYDVLFDPNTGAFNLMPGWATIRLPAELDPCNKPK
jgi:hypothetical protein